LSDQIEKRRLAEEQARRQDISNQESSACSLNAKAISYAHRICAAATCDAKFGVIEIVGRSVLEYAGARAGNRGIQYELGKTNDVTQDDSTLKQLLGFQASKPGTTLRSFATASYDGNVLTLYDTTLTFTQSDLHMPDNLVLGIHMRNTKIMVNACSTCRVVEFGISGHTLAGPAAVPALYNGPITEQTCKIDPMR
jgi:hypothetical protein